MPDKQNSGQELINGHLISFQPTAIRAQTSNAEEHRMNPQID